MVLPMKGFRKPVIARLLCLHLRSEFFPQSKASGYWVEWSIRQAFKPDTNSCLSRPIPVFPDQWSIFLIEGNEYILVIYEDNDFSWIFRLEQDTQLVWHNIGYNVFVVAVGGNITYIVNSTRLMQVHGLAGRAFLQELILWL